MIEQDVGVHGVTVPCNHVFEHELIAEKTCFEKNRKLRVCLLYITLLNIVHLHNKLQVNFNF